MFPERLHPEDAELLCRVQRRDRRALALLFDRHARTVYSVALRVLSDPVRAEQVLSDTFMEIWRDPGCGIPMQAGLSSRMASLARDKAVALLRPGISPDLSPHVPGTSRKEWNFAAFFPKGTQPPVQSPAKTSPEMDRMVAQLAGSGMQVTDLESDPNFSRRQLRHRDIAAQIDVMNRLAGMFLCNPIGILQELVAAAVHLCGADSAGISIEKKDGGDDHYYHWVATAGQYSGFHDAKLPRYPSACGLTLERGRPQLFQVAQRFFDRLHLEAPTVTDGLLLPWEAGETRGTIWIMAHGRDEAFDMEDCKAMQSFAKFAATGVRLQQQQKLLIKQARTSAELTMANRLAHQINNPLQGLIQTVYLFGRGGEESGVFAQQAMADVIKLSELVKGLLSVPH